MRYCKFAWVLCSMVLKFERQISGPVLRANPINCSGPLQRISHLRIIELLNHGLFVPNSGCGGWILHDWDDDRCLKLLKNCYNALPKFGKVVVVELIVPESPVTDVVTKNTLTLDICLFNVIPGAKERTKEEYEALARKAGFSTFKLV
ncbi:O-methyltransferase domain - like 10 [Theobroma cacao]|nr:O-methyltransferase domain - like 10 [Theobroma cacao]